MDSTADSSSASAVSNRDVGRMSNPTHSSRLPAINVDNVMDIATGFVILCPKCPLKRIPYLLMEQHANWHARINLLWSLRSATKSLDVSFGPSEPGCLVEVNYKSSEGRFWEKGNEIVERNLPSFLETLSTQPSTVLKYVEGLKYTFGNKFISRQTQGEFVYKNLKNKDQEVKDNCEEENYFKLECKDGFLWISTVGLKGLKPLTLISINGVALGNGTRTAVPVPPYQLKLRFGDILTITKSGHLGSEEIFRDFLFKTSTPSSKRPKIPYNNAQVIQNILSFLPTDKIQDLRLVSNCWNSEALRALRNRVIVTVLGNSSEDEVIQIHHYAHSELNRLALPHWKIDLPSDVVCDYGIPSQSQKRPTVEMHNKMVQAKKTLEDVKWFLDPAVYKHNVKSLRVTGVIKSSSNFSLFQAVLKGLNNTLTEVDLDIEFSIKSLPPSFQLQDFPVLTTLSICLGSRFGLQSFFQPFLEKLVSSMQNIQKLIVIDSPDTGAVAFRHTCRKGSMLSPSLVLDNISSLQAQEPQKFAHLTDIYLARCGNLELESLTRLRAGSLRKLRLCSLKTKTDIIAGVRDGGVEMLHSAIEKHAATLEKLVIHFEVSSDDVLRLRFLQKMPKLKTLSLMFILEGRVQSCKLGERGQLGNQSEGNVCIFPCLTQLTLWPFGPKGRENDVTWRLFLPIVKSFMDTVTDSNGQFLCFPGIENVRLPLLLEGKYHGVLDNFEDIFPNVDFSDELTDARQHPRSNVIAS